MPETEIPGWKCCRCGYTWAKKKEYEDKPVTCANQKCKTPYWDRPRRLEDYGKEKEQNS